MSAVIGLINIAIILSVIIGVGASINKMKQQVKKSPYNNPFKPSQNYPNPNNTPGAKPFVSNNYGNAPIGAEGSGYKTSNMPQGSGRSSYSTQTVGGRQTGSPAYKTGTDGARRSSSSGYTARPSGARAYGAGISGTKNKKSGYELGSVTRESDYDQFGRRIYSEKSAQKGVDMFGRS